MAEVNKRPRKSRLSQRGAKTMGRVLVIIAALLLLASVGAWWQVVRNNPKNTFNKMLENNLRTSSVTRTVKQNDGFQKIEQVMRIQNRTEHVSHGVTKFSQGGGKTVIVTESIGTPTSDFVKYNSIETNQKGSKGQALEFDDVLNVWGKTEVAEENQLGSLYQDTTLGNLFLFADLPADKRNAMLAYIRDNKVYDADYNSVKRNWQDGRQKYTYQVTVQPPAYIAMIKQYGADIGLTQLENLDPKNYEDAPPLKFTVTVDVLSQRVEKAVNDNGGSEQTYSGYGIFQNISLPKDTIQTEELQQRLSQSASV